MAPAPKSRVPKGEVVESGDKQPDGDVNLIEVEDDVKAQHKTVRRIAMSEGDLPQENGVQREREGSPRTASNLRRPSSITTGSDREGLLKRSSTAEMREHLKHLGPSNLASRPRQTRYNTVKIKPGPGAYPENPRKMQELAPESRASSVSKAQSGPRGVIGTVGKAAKDGVHAVQTSYGTVTASPKISSKATSSPPLDRNTSRASSPRSPDRGIQTPTDRKSGSRANSHSTLGSLRNRGTSQPPSPRLKKSLTISVARSGSITENIVEAGGIKKTVLEMSSSSEEQGDEPGASRDRPREREEREDRPVDEEREEQEDRPVDEERMGKTGGENGSGRKKRRRRKRKGGNDGSVEGRENEGTPLLGGRRRSDE
jgi:metal transporter CNNM